MSGPAKLRMFEIGIALRLTLAALLFVGLTVSGADTARTEITRGRQ